MRVYSWATMAFIFALTSCNLFKKNPPKKPSPIPESRLFFKEASANALNKALALDYQVLSNGSTYDMSIFPLSETPYACDYLLSGNQGFLKVLDSASQFSRSYQNYFGKDSQILSTQSSIWLSKINYQELQMQGWTTMQMNAKEKLDTFRVIGNPNFIKVGGDDSDINLQAINVESAIYKNKLQFYPNINYPLILTQDFKLLGVKLTNVQNKESNYADFVPGSKCILRYLLTEYGTNTYKFTATNVFWSDTLQCFHIDGSYEGSYTYDFEYDIYFRDKALSAPNFVVPVFSANGGKLTENKDHFFFFRKAEFDAMEKNGQGYLSIPHFAPSLEDGDTTGFTEQEKRRTDQNFKESYHTQFGLMRTGRLIHTGYYFNDDNTGNEVVLPSLSLRNRQKEMEVQVLNRGKWPLLLYFNDNRQWEITLEYAGY